MPKHVRITGFRSRSLTAGPRDHDACRVYASSALLSAMVCAAVGVVGCSDSGESKGKREPLRAFQYEETKNGLEQLFTDMLAAVADDDSARAIELAESLQLKAPEAWFKRVFGDQMGPTLFADYEPLVGSFSSFVTLMKSLLERGQTRFVVERFTKPDDPAAVGFQGMALGRMDRVTPLYSVRAIDRDGSRMFHIWSFVYQDGWFRWIGKNTSVGTKIPKDEIDVREYRLRHADAVREALGQ